MLKIKESVPYYIPVVKATIMSETIFRDLTNATQQIARRDK